MVTVFEGTFFEEAIKLKTKPLSGLFIKKKKKKEFGYRKAPGMDVHRKKTMRRHSKKGTIFKFP